MNKVIVATRRSALALTQSRMAVEHLRSGFPGSDFEFLQIVTQGDRHLEWSLERQGGKGLFTSELEVALMERRADIAVHSSKDLPGTVPAGLAIAGFLPREDARDLLVVRDGVESPRSIATGSPRRRLQVARLFPEAQFSEIRGNVETRLRKIAEGAADATLLAVAGLKRLRIEGWPGLVFRALDIETVVPAIGQAAIAIQCRAEDAGLYAPMLDAGTARQLRVERAIQELVGGGCNVAVAAHLLGNTLYFFHEKTGVRAIPLSDAAIAEAKATAVKVLRDLGLSPAAESA